MIMFTVLRSQTGLMFVELWPDTDKHTQQAEDAFVITAAGQIVDAMLSGKVMNVCEDDSKIKMSDAAQRKTHREMSATSH